MPVNPMDSVVVFDIETSSQDESELFAKFDPQFEVSSELLKREPVPHKGLKDPDKVAANLLEVQSKHQDWSMECEMDVMEQRQAWIQQGALRAERGKLLAFGYTLDGADVKIIHGYNEREVLSQILSVFRMYKSMHTFAGFNIMSFDLPFLRRRCIANDIKFPFYDRNEKWKPWLIRTYDAMVDWGCGVYGDRVKLDDLVRGLDCGKKTGNGADFAALYKSDQKAALAYLTCDCVIEYNLCAKLLAV